MTAVASEMKPSCYKDPTWISRDTPLSPGFPTAFQSPAEWCALPEFSMGTDSVAPASKGTAH